MQVELKVNKHLYLCHPLVLSSPTLMMHGHMNLKFVGACFFDTFITLYQTTRCYVPEDFYLHGRCVGNLRSNTTVSLSAPRFYLKLGILR